MNNRFGGRSPKAIGSVRAAVALALVLVCGVARGDGLEARYAGRSLADVLAALQARGLPLVFSSRLVRDDMQVRSEPRSTDPRALVDEILAPHGLEVRETGSGRWVVVRALGRPATVDVRGCAVDALSGARISGAEVRVATASSPATSGADGCFRVAGVAPGVHLLEVRHPGYRGLRRRIRAGSAGGPPPLFVLEPVTAGRERIDVTSDDPLHDRAGNLRFDSRELFTAGWRATDLGEVLRGLPGVAVRESSGEVSLNGGGADEIMVVLDGQELVEPYHLRDFGGVLSVVAGRVVESMEVHRGDLPPSYGDRMSGVIELTSRSPEAGWGGEVSAGPEVVQAGAFGAALGDRARWLLALRHGEPEVVSEIGESEEKPFYRDGFAKLLFAPRPDQELRLHVLSTEDGFEFTADVEQFLTDFNSRIVWLSHNAQLGPRLSMEAKVDYTEADRDRRGLDLGQNLYAIDDRRRLSRVGLQWRGSFAGDRHVSRWGLEARRDRAAYLYSNQLPVTGDPRFPFPGLPQIDASNPPVTFFDSTLRGEHYALFVAERRELRPWLVAEAGLRYDRSTLLDEEVVSPRVSLAAQLGGSVVRLAWGKASQSQRPYELQVPDREIELQPVERSEYAMVAFERAFGGVSLVVDAYYRTVSNPRPRYVNLFKPVSRFPEVEVDRVRLAPSSSEARGIEALLRGRLGSRVEWRMSYAASRARDTLAGRQLPRPNDQPHTVRFDLGWRAPRDWSVRLAWLGHSGWPTTPVLAEEIDNGSPGDDGVPPEAGLGRPEETLPPSYQAVLGSFHSERLEPFHRLDLVVSRSWQWRRYEVGFDLVLENLYDRENVRGFDTDLVIEGGTDGPPWVNLPPELGRGFLPRFQIRFGF